jgi:hypothetical protein
MTPLTYIAHRAATVALLLVFVLLIGLGIGGHGPLGVLWTYTTDRLFDWTFQQMFWPVR